MTTLLKVTGGEIRKALISFVGTVEKYHKDNTKWQFAVATGSTTYFCIFDTESEANTARATLILEIQHRKK